MLGYVLDEIFVQHRAPSGHPERPARVEAVRDALLAAHIRERGTQIQIRTASDAELAAIHSGAYLTELERVVPGKSGWLDPDTYFSPQTWNAALAAAGSACELATRVLSGELSQGIAVVRPPGHHAGVATPMGFCFLNNIAIAARHAQAKWGAERVAIVDFDVHHGNGTQEIFWADKSVLFCSTHQAPFYPGTGGRNETGEFNTVVNAPLFSGASGDAFQEAFADRILPRVNDFAPDIILISAGFDGHRRDPLGGLLLDERDFSEVTKRLLDIADRRCHGRVVSFLEAATISKRWRPPPPLTSKR